jgi:hypothetical protein
MQQVSILIKVHMVRPKSACAALGKECTCPSKSSDVSEQGRKTVRLDRCDICEGGKQFSQGFKGATAGLISYVHRKCVVLGA